MDFGLLSVPLLVLWKVRMGLLTKLRLYFVFSIASMSVVVASLHILSAFIPTKWKTVDGSTNPITPGNLPYRSTRRKSISGKREAGSTRERREYHENRRHRIEFQNQESIPPREKSSNRSFKRLDRKHQGSWREQE
ncbi:hypothetical protein L207DRAFT_512056 [Hyaloscypha variabilis F]|uniref:Uncharacterized protein n=1 Tax=Hyaloscypha variabilis (strain UAMH 11265 / GT02V1 / F) TaxID=1149755 RepID=A0A2J6RQ02_HYAVF|nr:hypothetical protein L207DRAFT_512056 [Hyaloscypha variabilis F]